ncbi:heavy-metal-associated domain-containing protein [Arthrobacter sp. H14-L1]|uniref:heavy-metal-associated domain-containing protein n=1 Tax=Arthrobacter sp. H14-L1 TaxID=2996697 RepID=UPI00226FE843|nr:heavy metal-associated domain-containing protein [Arthrobacter sp. H14-L1]MCY0904569.1 heavy metal-associated domain-containing protein [Arthrobacter sp. H14-L1]
MNPIITTVSISGMTCGHCVAAVSEELTSLKGVDDVSVDLAAEGISTATITSHLTISPEEIGEAVAEAGYLVVANDA